MMVRISGGRDAIVEAPFMIFQNANRSYPIQRVPDNLPGVSYRSGPKGGMDRTVFPQYLSGKKVIRPLPHGRKRILFVENCSGHGSSTNLATAFNSINTEVRFTPQCDRFDPASRLINNSKGRVGTSTKWI